MAWGRLALVHAAGEQDSALLKMAKVWGYAPTCLSGGNDLNEPGDNPIKSPDAIISPNPDSKKTSFRPSALFLRVNRRVQLVHQEDTEPPRYLNNPNLRLTASSSPKGTYRFSLPRPLLAMSRLLPFLHNSLGQANPIGKVDYRRLIKLLALAKPIRRLPTVTRQCWPQRLQIIVDTRACLEPYWTDFVFIIANLKKLLGAESVTAIRMAEDTLDQAQVYALSWPTEGNDAWHEWFVPPTNVAMLILSDLGMAETHPGARIRWQRWLKRLQAHPAPIVTLSPTAFSPQNVSCNRLVRPNPLNDAVQLPRHPRRDGFKLMLPSADRMQEMLAWLSFLPLVDAGLLRRLRDAFKWGGSELESMFWNHPDVYQTALGIRLRESAMGKYRLLYQQKLAGTPEARRLWQIVQQHHQDAYEGLRQLEAFHRCVLENPDQVGGVRDYFQRLCATVAAIAQENAHSTQYTALLMQCRTVLAFVPESVWQSESVGQREMQDMAYDLYAMAYQDDIRVGKWPDKLPTGFDPARLQWVLDERSKQERIQWQIVQTGPRGQFVCQRRASASSEARPLIALLDAQPAFPLTYAYSSGDGLQQEIVRDSQVFTLPEGEKGIVTLQTTLQRIELEAISKPSWATRIWYDAKGLWVSTPLCFGKVHHVPWVPGGKDNTGQWEFPSPMGVDQYGLYAELFVENAYQRFRWIVPGTFLMGSPESEEERIDDEMQHEVTLTRGFWLADSTCTQALWQAVMGDNPSYFQEDSQNPVESVSWHDVQQFIARLNGLFPELAARLPSEAEWEYACRAGTTMPFSYGEQITPEQVNYNGEYPYADGKKGVFRGKTLPVKSLPPNAWGLYEMHGNVWEWCHDWYGEYPAQAVTDPAGSSDSAVRVLRGGCWINYGWAVRSAYRYRSGPDIRNYSPGFRLALGQKREIGQNMQVSEARKHGEGEAADRASAAEQSSQDSSISPLCKR